MILKTAALALSLSLATLGASQALTITNFGDSSFENLDGYGIDATQTGSSIILNGLAETGSYFFGTLSTPVDLGSQTKITLTATASTAFGSTPFTLTFFDENFEESWQYLGDVNAFGSAPTTITLSLNPDFTGNYSLPIAGIMISFGGITDSSFSMTLTSLEAIPEPGVPLLIGFGLGATFLLRRVRRTASGAPALG